MTAFTPLNILSSRPIYESIRTFVKRIAAIAVVVVVTLLAALIVAWLNVGTLKSWVVLSGLLIGAYGTGATISRTLPFLPGFEKRRRRIYEKEFAAREAHLDALRRDLYIREEVVSRHEIEAHEEIMRSMDAYARQMLRMQEHFRLAYELVARGQASEEVLELLRLGNLPPSV